MPTRRRRTYESSLRAEQVDRTRDKLLAAAVEILGEDDAELTVRTVAARANVSVPTAYRYFPDRDALVEAIAQWISARVISQPFPTKPGDMASYLRSTFEGFAANEALVRAQLNTHAGRSVRAKHRKARNAQTLELMKAMFPKSSAPSQRRAAALLRMIVGLNTWVSFRDEWGMEEEEILRVVMWAFDTLRHALEKTPAALD